MQPMKPEVKSEVQPERVAFHQKPAVVLLALMFASLAASLEWMTRDNWDHSGRIAHALEHTIALFLFCITAWVLYAIFLQRGSVDAQGIRWHNHKGRQSTCWDEVTDFYQTIKGTFVVRTERDKITFLPGLANIDRLRAFVTAHCGERPGLTTWELYGLRPQDFPQVFGYPVEASQRKSRVRRALQSSIGSLMTTGCILFFCLSAYHAPTKISIVIASAVFLTLLLSDGLSAYRTAIAVRARAGQKFTTQADGFTYDTGREAVFVAWNDVIGYDFNPQAASKRARLFPPLDVLRIRTEQGQEFAFLTALDRVELWKETIRRSATNGIETKIDEGAGAGIGRRRTLLERRHRRGRRPGLSRPNA